MNGESGRIPGPRTALHDSLAFRASNHFPMRHPDGNHLSSGQRELDELLARVRSFLEQDVLDVTIDAQRIRGYRTPDARSIWIRDHSDMLRAGRYFETDVQTAVQHFADTQAISGRIFDYFTTYPEKLPSERENWTKYVRVPVEADVEYRFVKAVYLAWQASGDTEWMRALLPNMERALHYATTHPWRVDPATGLIRRAYTIDTWDFAYTAGRHAWLQFQIDEATYWGIMHGDNSGCYEALRLLARMQATAGTAAASTASLARADVMRRKLDEVCWNGRFYTHFVKRTPVQINGVDEAEQLSLSNPMNINRGVCSVEQARSILREYRERGQKSGAFAEWFSIDPPFPDGAFGDEKLVAGAYCNGGIMPLVGGELALAALENGEEAYGVDVLRRYHALTDSGETYLWYFPDGRPSSVETSTSPEALPTDGWGSSAMLHALIQGLAGVRDDASRFQQLHLAPRWHAAGAAEAEVRLRYPASDAALHYGYREAAGTLSLAIETAHEAIQLHLLLPSGSTARKVTVRGEAVPFRIQTVGESVYLDVPAGPGPTSLRVDLA